VATAVLGTNLNPSLVDLHGDAVSGIHHDFERLDAVSDALQATFDQLVGKADARKLPDGRPRGANSALVARTRPRQLRNGPKRGSEEL